MSVRDPRNPLSGGAERVSLGYLKALSERGHEVCWFAFDYPGGLAEEVFEGVTIIRGGNKGSAILRARAWYQKQPRFDLVIDQHHGLPWFAPWWCGTRCVSYIHEVLGPIWNAFYPWPVSALGRFQERWTHWFYRHCLFWTASSLTKERLKKHGVKTVKTIPYGVDTVPLTTLPDKTVGEVVKLICVSRLAPNKRIDHCLKAVDCLRNRGVRATLKVVGGGEERERLEALRTSLKLEVEVAFTGAMTESEKETAMREADFILHASGEGWGLNIIEANAMGTPAVVYRSTGSWSRRFMANRLRCGRGDAGSLTEGIMQAINDPGFMPLGVNEPGKGLASFIGTGFSHRRAIG